MKKLIIVFLAVLSFNWVFSQKDTTKIVWKKGEILLITDRDSNNLNTSKKTEDTILIKFKSKRFKSKWAGISIGTTGFLTKAGSFDLPETYSFLELNQPKSINFNINLIEKNINLIKNQVGIVTGLGFSWNNYRFNKKIVLTTFDTLSYLNDTLIKKSKLTVSLLRVPLLFEFHIPINNSKNIIYISAGAVGALRIGTHSKQTYIVKGDLNANKNYNDFYLNPLFYSLDFRMGIDNFGLYFNYQPMSLFKNNKGPELYGWSIGISLSF
jgi:hypothetical protein